MSIKKQDVEGVAKTAKEEKSNGKKKYTAKAVLVGQAEGTIHVGQEVELTEEQAKRLIELNAIVDPEAEEE